MDEIKNPHHYARYALQPAEFNFTNDIEWWRGSIIKYACRAGYKGDWETEIQDLEKIKEFCEMRIRHIRGKPVNE
jgi:hypothetical protein